MDLSTDYLGLELDNPLVISACQPLSDSVERMERMQEAGAGAIVQHSLFEEQITQESLVLDHYLSYGEESFAEAMDFFPDMESYELEPLEYIDQLEEASDHLDIPVIGSLNGVSSGGWIQYAQRMEEAGADALELNIYFLPSDTRLNGDDVEQMYVNIVSDVDDEIDIPMGAKIGPFFSSIPHMAERLSDAGADGLVLFNRFYQPDFNIDELEVEPDLELSRSYDMRLPMRWVAILNGKVNTDFAITSGVHDYEDVLKGMMAGANVSMMASEILKNGPRRLWEIKSNIEEWMEEHEYESIRQMQGSMSQVNLETPNAVERAHYTETIHSWRPDPTGSVGTRDRTTTEPSWARKEG